MPFYVTTYNQHRNIWPANTHYTPQENVNIANYLVIIKIFWLRLANPPIHEVN